MGQFSMEILGCAGSVLSGNQHSLINSAKLNGLDPYTWLADVLERIVSGNTTINRLDTLLPWNWRADQVAQAA